MRKNHKVNILELDQNAARAIQIWMNRASFTGIMPKAQDRDPTFLDCGEQVFFQADKLKEN